MLFNFENKKDVLPESAMFLFRLHIGCCTHQPKKTMWQFARETLILRPCKSLALYLRDMALPGFQENRWLWLAKKA